MTRILARLVSASDDPANDSTTALGGAVASIVEEARDWLQEWEVSDTASVVAGKRLLNVFDDPDVTDALDAYRTALHDRRVAENAGRSTRALIDAHRDAGVRVADALELFRIAVALQSDYVAANPPDREAGADMWPGDHCPYCNRNKPQAHADDCQWVAWKDR